MARLSEHMRHCAQALNEEANNLHPRGTMGGVVGTTYVTERFKQEASNYEDFARFIEERDALIVRLLDKWHQYAIQYDGYEGTDGLDAEARLKELREALAISYEPGVKVA